MIAVARADFYFWSSGEGLSSTNVSDPIANPTETTVYSLIEKTTFGCTNSDSVLYLINPSPFLITSSLNDIKFNSGQYAILNNKHTNYGEKFIPISLTIERLWQRQYYYQHGRNF